MSYTHLTREERYQIYALKHAGQKQREIAHVLERSALTISREMAATVASAAIAQNRRTAWRSFGVQ
ncbi:MAG: helix-turn-helix domain-containing protein [Thiobacillus sp.]